MYALKQFRLMNSHSPYISDFKLMDCLTKKQDKISKNPVQQQPLRRIHTLLTYYLDLTHMVKQFLLPIWHLRGFRLKF